MRSLSVLGRYMAIAANAALLKTLKEASGVREVGEDRTIERALVGSSADLARLRLRKAVVPKQPIQIKSA
jgi:hypothetical protein